MCVIGGERDMKELRKRAAGIRAAFFDIDGTLLDFGKPDLSPAVRQALA